jgi:hypothetical protein
MTLFLSEHEAYEYLKTLMRSRNVCENARSRMLLKLRDLIRKNECVTPRDIETIVLGVIR